MQTPDRELPRRPRRRRAGTCASPPAPASRRCSRSPRTVLAHPDAEVTLLYGNRTSGSVMFAEELGDLKNRYGPRFQLVHVLSREPRDVELFSGRLDADRLRRLLDGAGPGRRRRPRLAVRAVRDDQRRPRACSTELGVPADRVHFELFYVDEPPPELHRADPVARGRDQRGDRRPRRAQHDRADAAGHDDPRRRRRRPAPTCRSPARAASAAPAAPWSPTARSTCAATTRSRTAEVDAGFVLTCQTYPVSDDVTVDFDA